MVNIGDLPLELIQKIAQSLDPKDVLEMMITDKRLYSFYLNDPSIIFGTHVYAMSFDWPGGQIKKSASSSDLLLDVNNFGHLQSIKRIHSCEYLMFSCDVNAGHETIFRQLKSVQELRFTGRKEDSKKFFANFRVSIRRKARLFFWDLGEVEGEEVESMKEQLGDFIETQLSVCEKVSLSFGLAFSLVSRNNLYRVCLDALSKTQIKLIQTSSNLAVVERIVKHGIPSQNPHAAFFHYCKSPMIRAKIVAFLTNYPRMKQIHGDDRWSLYEQVKKLCGENFYDLFSSFIRTDPTSDLDGESWYFRGRIDSAKDCVYILKCARLHADYDDSYFFDYYAPGQ